MTISNNTRLFSTFFLKRTTHHMSTSSCYHLLLDYISLHTWSGVCYVINVDNLGLSTQFQCFAS